jgi:hypothetical protein
MAPIACLYIMEKCEIPFPHLIENTDSSVAQPLHLLTVLTELFRLGIINHALLLFYFYLWKQNRNGKYVK